MPLERWILDKRLAVCRACPRAPACPAIASTLALETRCPEQRHPTRAAEIAARAWPAEAPRLSGCCDPIPPRPA